MSETDRRYIAEVILEAAATEHGLRQFALVVSDGRADRVPRRLDRDGAPVRAAGHDGFVEFDEKWFRSQWGGATDGEVDADDSVELLNPP